MKKLLDRAPFCPIGVKSNTRVTVTTFVKLCKHHQSLAAGSAKKYEGVSLIHTVACTACPVGPHIVRNEDPVLVVGDIEWITFDEIQQIQNRVSGIITEISKSAKSRIRNRGKKNMRTSLLKLQALLKQAEIILSEMLQGDDTKYVGPEEDIEAEVAPIQPEPVAIPVEVIEPASAPTSKKKQLGARSIALSKELYALEQQGKSRAFLATHYQLSKKYVSSLIAHYAASLQKKS